MVGVIGVFLFVYVYTGMNGNEEREVLAAKELKGQMEEKYGISIIESDRFYSNSAGYGATFTADNGIIFDAWERQDGSIDTYREEVWRKKGTARWGYADEFIPNVRQAYVDVGYKDGMEGDVSELERPIEEMKESLWIWIYVDLEKPYQALTAKETEQSIYRYYERLQQDGAEAVALIVRHKDDTGSYMITFDENSDLPDITRAEDISREFID
ncbi:hypothetical protein [Pradoshia sp.]